LRQATRAYVLAGVAVTALISCTSQPPAPSGRVKEAAETAAGRPGGAEPGRAADDLSMQANGEAVPAGQVVPGGAKVLPRPTPYRFPTPDAPLYDANGKVYWTPYVPDPNDPRLAGFDRPPPPKRPPHPARTTRAQAIATAAQRVNGYGFASGAPPTLALATRSTVAAAPLLIQKPGTAALVMGDLQMDDPVWAVHYRGQFGNYAGMWILINAFTGDHYATTWEAATPGRGAAGYVGTAN